MYVQILVYLYFVVFKMFTEMFSLVLDCILVVSMMMADKAEKRRSSIIQLSVIYESVYFVGCTV